MSQAAAQQIAIILNPNSGTAAKGGTVADITAALAPHQATVVIASGHDIPEAARRAVESGSSIVVAAGGDGTVNAVASVVAGTRARLGVLPLGTLNHFAKDLGIPTDIPAALKTLIDGNVITVDVGDVNGRMFVNNSSLGLYPRLVWERAQEQRRGRGKWPAFLLALLRVWRRYRRVAVAVNDGEGVRIVRTPFVFVGNNEYLLEGVRIGARTRLDAGFLHVCMAPGLQRMEVFRVLLAALAGRLDGIDRFESVRTKEFAITARRRRLGVSLDGELTTMRTPLRYRVRPGALQVIAPQNAGRTT